MKYGFMMYVYIFLSFMIIGLWMVGVAMIRTLGSRPGAPDPAPAYKLMRGATWMMFAAMCVLVLLHALIEQFG